MSQDTTPKRPLRHGVARKIRLLLVDKPGESGRQHMSEAELGRLLGWSQTYIARRMRGVNDFTLDDLEAIAHILDVPITELFPVTGQYEETVPAKIDHAIMQATPLPRGALVAAGTRRTAPTGR